MLKNNEALSLNEESLLSLKNQDPPLFFELLSKNNPALLFILNNFCCKEPCDLLTQNEINQLLESNHDQEWFREGLSSDFLVHQFEKIDCAQNSVSEDDTLLEKQATFIARFISLPSFKEFLDQSKNLSLVFDLVENPQSVVILRDQKVLDQLLPLLKNNPERACAFLKSPEKMACLKRPLHEGQPENFNLYMDQVTLIKDCAKILTNEVKKDPNFRKVVLAIMRQRGGSQFLLSSPTFKGDYKNLVFASEPVKPGACLFVGEEEFCKDLLLESDYRQVLTSKNRLEILEFLINQDKAYGFELFSNEENVMALTPIERFEVIVRCRNQKDWLQVLSKQAAFKKLLGGMLCDESAASKILNSDLVNPKFKLITTDQIQQALQQALVDHQDSEEFINNLKLPFFKVNHPVAGILRHVNLPVYQQLLFKAALVDSKLATTVLRNHVSKALAEDQLANLNTEKDTLLRLATRTDDQIHRFAKLVQLIEHADQRVKNLNAWQKDRITSDQVSTLLNWHGNSFLKNLGKRVVNFCVRLIKQDPSSAKIEQFHGNPYLVTCLDKNVKAESMPTVKSFKQSIHLALAQYANRPLTYSRLRQTLEIWRGWHHRTSTLFSPGRWFKPEGMPQTMLDLQQLVNCLPKDVDPNAEISGPIIKALEVIIEDRVRRDSSSFRNMNSHTSKLVAALRSASTLKQVEVVKKKHSISWDNAPMDQLENQFEKVIKPAFERNKSRIETSRENAQKVINTVEALIKNFQGKDCKYNFAQHGQNLWKPKPTDIMCYIHFEKYTNWDTCKQGFTTFIRQYIATYELYLNAGKEASFFETLSTNLCIEGTTQGMFIHAAQLSQQATFSELMTNYMQIAIAYSESMGQEITNTSLTAFILERHRDESFRLQESDIAQLKEDYKLEELPQYFDSERLNRENIAWYLEENGYDDVPASELRV